MSAPVTCACGAPGQRGDHCADCGLPLLRVKVPRRLRDDRPPRRRGPLVLAVSLLAVAGGIGALVVAARDRTAPERERRARVRAEVARVLPELRRFVEETRGLAFREDVGIDVVDGEAFAARYAGAGVPANPLVRVRRAGDGDRLAKRGATFTALGAVADPGAFAAGDEAFEEGVRGFYDSASKSLVVRGSRLDAEGRYVLVHELVHALQDQHFGLARPPAADGDAQAAWDALVEGDATDVAEAYRRSLPAADAAGVPGVGAAAAGPAESLRVFPYTAGARFVSRLRELRGREALDGAYRDPPESTRQVLHPESFLSGTPPRPVARPEPAGRVLDEGVLGELGLYLALGGDAGAAVGWAGDAYVTYAEGARTCLKATVLMDTAADRDELVRAARRRTGWTAAATGPREVAITACR